MNSKPEAQNEPTMEEILASIRRIISEDEPQAGKLAEAIPAATPPSARPAAAAPAEAGRGADNILELTKMVAEDGSIVDLAAEAEAASADGVSPEEAPEETAEETAEETTREPAAEELPADFFGAGPAAEEQAAEEEPADEEPVLQEPAPEEPAAEESVGEEPADEEATARELLASAEDEPMEDAAAGEEEAVGSAARVPSPAGEGSDYVSAVTAAAATASLAAVTKAAMANRQGDAVAIGGGRTLEELVRESLAPELKGWLDDNLPELVERIVREEIRKMIRRAEDQ